MVCFEVIVVRGVISVSSFSFLLNCPVITAQFVDKSILSPFITIAHFAKIS